MPEGRQQTHQEGMSQEEEEANVLARHQDFNSSSRDLGETTGHNTADPKMMLLYLLTILHVNSQLVDAESK